MTTRVLSCSKTELSLSRTESLARLISSIRSRPPYCIDSTKIPSCHSNTQLKSSRNCLTFVAKSFSFLSFYFPMNFRSILVFALREESLSNSSTPSVKMPLDDSSTSDSWSWVYFRFRLVLMHPIKSEVSVFW